MTKLLKSAAALACLYCISCASFAKPVPFLAKGDGHLGRASDFNQQENYPAAIAEMDKAIEEDPNDCGAYELRAAFKVRTGDCAGALADINFAIEKEPYDYCHYARRIEVYTAMGDEAAAKKDMETGMALIKADPLFAPQDWNSFHDAAFKYNDEENYAAAVAEMDKAIEAAPNYLIAYSFRSHYKERMKDYAGALADITMAIELLEKYPWDKFVRYPRDKKHMLLESYDERMHINGMRLHDIPALMKDIETVLSMDQSAKTYAMCGFHATQTYDPKLRPLAIEYYTKAIELDPTGNNGSYYRWRGMSKLNEGDYKGAEYDYGKSLEYHDEDGPAYCSRGETRYHLGDLENALKDMHKAREFGYNCSRVDFLMRKIKDAMQAVGKSDRINE